MRKIFIMGAVLSILALPAASWAQSGGAAGDEYTENVPGGGGEQPSNEVTGGGTGSGDLPPGTAAALEAQGADGERAADLAQATAPKQGDKGSSVNTNGSSGSANDGSGGGVGGVIDQLAGGNDSDEGMGVILPIVLGIAVIGALALFIIRRRASSGPEQPA